MEENDVTIKLLLKEISEGIDAINENLQEIICRLAKEDD